MAIIVLSPDFKLTKTKNQNLRTMLDKIAKSNKIMALVSIATLVIVAFVLVYKPWKANKDKAAE